MSNEHKLALERENARWVITRALGVMRNSTDTEQKRIAAEMIEHYTNVEMEIWNGRSVNDMREEVERVR